MSDSTYFPSDYDQARGHFLAALGPDWKVGKWKIPSGVDFELYVDHAYRAPKGAPEKLYVLVSGIHGLEAYTGSAIQKMFLNEMSSGVDRERTGFLLVHCMNPYGFKYHRRSTENDVNLNRNCGINPELYNLKNDESLRLGERFVPKKPVESTTSELISRMKREGKSVRFDEIGLDELTKAVSMGQYVTPQGFEFGGLGPEPQVAALIEKLKETMPAFKDVILFDLHTGLGERGRLHLLTDDSPGCVEPTLFAELFDLAADKDVYDFTPSDAEGFYPTFGALNGLFPALAKPGQRVCALTMEFGTMGHDLEAQIEGLNRWMLEHQGIHYGYKSPELEIKIRGDYLERFNPSAPEWRENTIRLARELFRRVFARAGTL